VHTSSEKRFGWRRLPRWRRVLAVILIAAGVVVAAGLVSVEFDEASVRRSGEVAAARVLDVNYKGQYADVRFTTGDGDIVLAEVHVSVAEEVAHEGDVLEVRYRAEDPSDSVVVANVDSMDLWVDRLVGTSLMIAAVMLPACWALGLIRRRP
jgi:hypothetical protein